MSNSSADSREPCSMCGVRDPLCTKHECPWAEARVTICPAELPNRYTVLVDGRPMYLDLTIKQLREHVRRARESLATNAVPISSVLVSAFSNVWAGIAADCYVETQRELIEVCLPSLDTRAFGAARQELTGLIERYGLDEVLTALAKHPHLQYV